MEVTLDYKAEQAGVRKSVCDSSSFTTAYVTMNTLAAVIACYGLLSDNIAAVIGAMIVATLLGPITGIALALVDGDNDLLKRALMTELGGVLIVLAASFVIGRLQGAMPLSREVLARTSPNILDLAIALAAGAAGAYATVSARVAVGLVGVAVATALVPPLASCGLCFAHGEMRLAFGSLLLFLANFVAIQFASSVVMWAHGYHEITHFPSRTSHRIPLRIGPSLILLVALAGGFGYNFRQTLREQRFEAEVRARLVQELSAKPGAYLADLRFDRGKGRTTVIAVVRTPFSLPPTDVAAIESKLPRVGARVELHIRSIITKEATRSVWLHESGGTPSDTATPPVGDQQPGDEGRGPASSVP